MPRKLKSISTEFELRLDELPRFESGVVVWNEVFGSHDPLRVEIGVGNSTFLIEVAKGSPHFQYLGFEYRTRRLLKFLKKVHKAELENIRMLRVDVTQVFDRIFAAESVDHFYINHPDPWPKRRHAKKRLVNDWNIRIMTHLLRPGGGISLRTDCVEYVSQMLTTLERAENLENLFGLGNFAPVPRPPHLTPFEKKFKAAGKRIFYLEYHKPSSAAAVENAPVPRVMRSGGLE